MSERTEAFKTILLYLGWLVGIVALTTWLTSSGSYQAEFFELPTATPQAGQVTPTATRRLPTPTAEPAETAGCQVTPGSMRYGYKPNAPFTNNLVSPALQRRGERLVIAGTVYAADCRTPLPEVLIEVWQANPEGDYDYSGDFKLRGQLKTDAQGRYRFTTIKPGRYVTGTEPLPALINYRVSYQEGEALFTQLFFAGDPFLNRFPFVVPPLVISLTERTEEDGSFLEGTFDIVLPVAGSAP